MAKTNFGALIFLLCLVVIVETVSLRYSGALIGCFGIGGVILFYMMKGGAYGFALLMFLSRKYQTLSVPFVAVVLVSLTALVLTMPVGGSRYVAVFYYPWQFKEWMEETGSDVYPLIGRYNFGEPAVIREQLDQIASCQVDFVIFSWLGMDDLSVDVFYNVVKETDLKFAVMYEYNFERRGRLDYLQASADFIYNQYASQPCYFKLYDKPLFYVFTQFSDGVSDIVNLPAWNDHRFTVKYAPLISAYNNIFTQNIPPLGPLGQAQAYTSDIVSVCPGAEWTSSDGYHTASVYMSRENGDTYRSQWDFAVSVGKLSPHKTFTAVICSWNEYTERTQIEPTVEYGNLYLEITRMKVAEFKNL